VSRYDPQAFPAPVCPLCDGPMMLISEDNAPGFRWSYWLCRVWSCNGQLTQDFTPDYPEGVPSDWYSTIEEI
jgi:hypothetical protein